MITGRQVRDVTEKPMLYEGSEENRKEFSS